MVPGAFMAMALPSFLVWLGSMDTVRFKGHRISISAEASLDECIRDRDAVAESKVEVGDDDHSSKIWGLGRISDVQIYDAMMVLPAEAKRQLDFWQQITGSNLHGQCYIFTCDDVVPLDRPAMLQQFGQRRFRSFLTELEPEQGPRMWRSLNYDGDCPCHVVLRVPQPFVEQVVQGPWNMLLLPHLPNTCRTGSSTLTMNWPAIGVKASSPCIPQLPPLAKNFPGTDNSVALSAQLVDEAVDFMKS